MTETPTQELVARIKQSLANGTLFVADYQSLIKIATDPTRPLVRVTVDIDAALNSLAQMPSLVGLPVGNLVPTNLPLLHTVFSIIHLKSVSFTLATAKKRVIDMQCVIAFGDKDKDGKYKGATLTIGSEFAVTLDTLALSLVTPGGAFPPQLLAAAQGSMQINGKPLDVALLFPDAVLSIKEPPLEYISIADFLGLFGLEAGKPFSDLNVVDLDFYTDLSSRAVSFSANVIYLNPDTDNFLPLIPGTLGISQMGFSFSHDADPVAYRGSVSGILDFKLPTGKAKLGLIFAVQAAYDASLWTFSGNIDVAATKQAWGVTDAKGLTLAAISENMFGVEGSLLPSGLGDLYIAACAVSYTSGGSDYSFDGVFGGQWQVGELDVQSQVSIAISPQRKRVNCDFIVAVGGYGNNGFAFELGYDFEAKIATAAIPAIGLTGDFDEKAVNLSFGKDLSLESLVEWFVRSVTGNPGFAFSPPWSTIFSAFGIPSGTSLSIGLNDKSVSCTYKVGKTFFGNTLDSIEISYDPNRQTEKLKLALNGEFPALILSNGEAPEKGKPVGWDPSKPGTEPSVPGLGSVFELDLVALGQHIAFPTPAPQSVEKAVDTLVKALQEDQGQPRIFPKGLEFSDQSGWLIGTKAVFAGQIEAEIIFNDPNIYGLMITVVEAKGKSPSDPKLAAFTGLYFEVLYRKINDAIGEYYVALTLPKQFRKLDFGEVVVQLPSFSLAVYTNGNFKIDLGFPYKADFSKSFAVTYLVFTGQGGFYFGYLSGATADALPAYDPDKGDFNPVIELGLGLAVGIQRGFNAGPLSAQISLLLEAIIQGTYAKYSLFQAPASGPSSDVYYKLQGTVRFVGELTGKVDLVIITASVLVRLVAAAVLVMEAYKKTQAGFSIEVSVAVTVKIGVGIFSIHIHLSFHTRVSESFAFGSDGNPLWRPKGLEEVMLAAVADSGPVMGWQPVTYSDKPHTFCPLHTYFVPQLTIAGEGSPQYVGMLYLNNPQQQGAAKVDYQDTTPSFDDFATGILLWVLNAYDNSTTDTPISQQKARAKPISAKAIDDLQGFFEHTNDPFTIAQLQAFTGGYFQLKIAQLAASDGKPADYGLAFFPMLDELQVSYVQSDQLAAMLRPEPVSVTGDYVDHLKGHTEAGALAQEYLEGFAAVKRPAAIESTPLSLDQRLLLDYVMLVIKFGLKEAATAMAAASPPTTIGKLLDALQGQFGGAAGFASRYMLHGIQAVGSTGADTLEPLYRLTDQQFAVTGTTADHATIELALRKDARDSWNLLFPQGNALVIESGDGLFKSPKQIADGMSLNFDPAAGGKVSAGALDIAHTAPKRFGLNMRTDWNAQIGGKDSALWPLPSTLMAAIAAGDGNIPFEIYQGSFDSDSGEADEPAKLLPTAFCWATLISFTIRRIADAGGSQGEATYLDGVYELAGVDATGLLRLVDILQQPSSALGDMRLAFAYAERNKQGHVSAFHSDTSGSLSWSLVQSNLSTESRPPALMAMAAGEGGDTTILTFLLQLWEGGITNSGGYYFHYYDSASSQGVPADLFDADGKAELMAVVGFPNAAEARLPATYINYVQMVRPSPQDNSFFYASSDKVEATTATILPGHIGIEVSRPVPPVGGGAVPGKGKEDYGPSLNHLYNLLTCYISKLGDVAQAAPKRTTGISPLADGPAGTGADGEPWVYRKVLPLLPAMAPAGDGNRPPAGLNPYAAVGQDVSFFSAWTDVFGNHAAPAVGLDPIPAGYYDPVTGLGQLPQLNADYHFASGGEGGSARLDVRFTFNVDSYTAYQADVEKVYASVAQILGEVSSEAGTAWKACTTLAQRSALIADVLDQAYGVLNGAQASTLRGVEEHLSSVEQRLANDQQCYATFYYQLIQYQDPKKNITGYLASSMLRPLKDGAGNKLPGIDIGAAGLDTLQANAAAVYAFFQNLAAWLGDDPSKALPLAPVLQTLSLTHGFESASLIGDYLYVLDVSLVLRRDGSYVLAPFKDTEAQSSTSMLLPQHDPQPSKDAPLTYTRFAKDFAAAFISNSMQVASGAAWEAGQAAQGKQFWVLRYGEHGIGIKSGTVQYFAPRPLSKQLMSLSDVAVHAFDSTTGKLNEGSTVTVTDVDLDALMGRFLLAFERFLAPESAVAASMANGDAFTDILQAKRDIAEQLSQTVTNLDPPKSPVAPDFAKAAAERLKQECLVSLSNFYEVDAVISQELTGSCQGGGTPPALNLFGSPAVVDGKTQPDNNFSLSTAKAPIEDGASYLAYSLKSKRKGVDGRFDAKLQFDIGAIEHGMQTISDGKVDYTSGAWVRLLLAPPPVDLGEIGFQIPLRAYPTPPSLLGQAYESVLAEKDGADGIHAESDQSGTLIEKAKEWAYDVVYGHRYVAQDTVYNRTTINVGRQDGLQTSFADNAEALLKALVDFDQNIAAIEAFLAAQLPHVMGAKTVPSNVIEAVASFRTLVQEVAGILASGPEAELLMQATGLTTYQSQYMVTEGVPNPVTGKDDGIFYVEVKRGEKGPHPEIEALPEPWIAGLETVPINNGTEPAYYQFLDKKTPLTIAEAAAYTERKLRLQPLNIIDRQNGRAEIKVVRNQGLPSAFVYETPYIAYPEIVTPHLDLSTPINVANVGGGSADQDIPTHLQELFGVLLSGTGDVYTDQSGSFRIVGYYQYPWAWEKGEGTKPPVPLQIEVPVLFSLPTSSPLPFDPSNPKVQAYIRNAASRMQAWAINNRPAHLSGSETSVGSFRFDITIFTELSASGEPILRLRDLYLPADSVKLE